MFFRISVWVPVLQSRNDLTISPKILLRWSVPVDPQILRKMHAANCTHYPHTTTDHDQPGKIVAMYIRKEMGIDDQFIVEAIRQ